MLFWVWEVFWEKRLRTRRTSERKRERMRERLRETRENDLRKLTQTEGKGKDAHTLTHVPQTQIRNFRIERRKRNEDDRVPQKS